MEEARVPEIQELVAYLGVDLCSNLTEEADGLGEQLSKFRQIQLGEKVSAGVRNGGCEPQGTRLGIAQPLPSSPA